MSRTNLAYADNQPTIFTVREYLTFERNALDKHEYYDGEIITMAGASEKHNTITVNILVGLQNKLRGGGCRVYTSDMRTRINKTRYVYPDVVAVCGERLFEDDELDVLLNPNAVFEVLSKSTKVRDKNQKRESYIALESVSDCVLVDQDQIHIEHYARNSGDEWTLKVLTDKNQKIILSSLNCELLLSEIYAEIDFPPAVLLELV